MKFNKYLRATAMLITLVAVFFVTGKDALGQGKQNAPGQTKKENQSGENQGSQQKENKDNQGNSKKQEDQVIVGSVDDVSGNTIQVEEKKGKKQEVTIDKQTKVVGQDNKQAKLGAIKLKDIIAAIGTEEGQTATQTGKFKVKKLFVQEATASAQMKRRAVQGMIMDISGSIVTLSHQIQEALLYTIIVNDETVIKTKEASESGTLASLAVGQRIVAVGDLSETGGILAKRIHVIPGKATGIFKKQPVATPSAVITSIITATPSAAPTSSATPSTTPTSTLPEESPTPTLTL